MNSATLKQGMHFLKIVSDKDLSLEELQLRLDSGVISDVLDLAVDWGKVNRDAVRVALGLPKLVPDPVITELPGIVLPELTHSLAERIAAGAYDWTNSDITAERFPLTLPAGPRQLVLVHFDRAMTGPQVEQWAKDNSYEAALVDDLLAVGSHPRHRELQRQYPIAALGSSTVLRGDRRVPYLCRDDAERSLNLYDYDVGWGGDDRFLLRKVS